MRHQCMILDRSLQNSASIGTERATDRAMAQATQAERARRERWGFLSGSIMALGASLSFAAARAGVVGGLAVPDMIFARFLVAGAIMLPLLVRACLLTTLGGARLRCCRPAATASRRWPTARSLRPRPSPSSAPSAPRSSCAND